jgi:hypothetical protein
MDCGMNQDLSDEEPGGGGDSDILSGGGLELHSYSIADLTST